MAFKRSRCLLFALISNFSLFSYSKNIFFAKIVRFGQINSNNLVASLLIKSFSVFSVYSLVEDGLITMYIESKGGDYIETMTHQPVYNSLSR